jgi:hypothetical protein
MPPKKVKKTKSPRQSEEDVKLSDLDVQYNPDVK